ncbi:MAG: DMT family transporter [Pseudomonadaceae bacterium]|nr:DMT family transporter [Pseudomonadaceae bacterium]
MTVLQQRANNSETQATVFALVAVCLWSTVATGFKLGLQLMTPLQLLLLGSLISTTVFVLVAGRSLTRLTASDWRLAGLLGLINPGIYYLVLFEAYERLPAQIAQPLNYTWAITLALLAVPILGQKLRPRALLGMLVSYAGVVLLVARPGADASEAVDSLGIALALASTVLWALYWLINTRSHAPATAMMAASFLLGSALLVAASAISGDWPQLTWTTTRYGAWVGLIEMGVTFLLWQQALKRTQQSGRIAQLIFISPFLSLLMINSVLGETVHWSAVAALALIIVGLMMTNINQPADQV